VVAPPGGTVVVLVVVVDLGVVLGITAGKVVVVVVATGEAAQSIRLRGTPWAVSDDGLEVANWAPRSTSRGWLPRAPHVAVQVAWPEGSVTAGFG